MEIFAALLELFLLVEFVVILLRMLVAFVVPAELHHLKESVALLEIPIWVDSVVLIHKRLRMEFVVIMTKRMLAENVVLKLKLMEISVVHQILLQLVVCFNFY